MAVVAVGALFAFAQLLRRTSMFFPSPYPAGDWSTSADEVSFTAADGVRLHGWWFRGSSGAPLLIWFHGNAGNITGRKPMAEELAARGVSVLLFDYRGFGKSDGSPSESALYRDALGAYDFAVASGVSPDDIALYGESIGGPYAAYVAKERRVRSVIIESSFPSLAALGNALYRPLPLGWTAPFAMRTAEWLNQAGRPVLVLHGRRDAVIPYALGKRLYDELRVPKEMLTCESAGHCEIPVVDSARYYERVVRWVATAR